MYVYDVYEIHIMCIYIYMCTLLHTLKGGILTPWVAAEGFPFSSYSNMRQRQVSTIEVGRRMGKRADFWWGNPSGTRLKTGVWPAPRSL